MHVNAHLNSQVQVFNSMPMIWFEQLGMPSGLAKRNLLRFSIWELKPSYDFLELGSYSAGYCSDVI